MTNMTVRRVVVAGLGAAAGALAAAAFVSTAPIASADDGSAGSGVDYSALAVPAATFPDFTFDNTFTIGVGNAEDIYTTVYNGTGAPVTTMTVDTLPTGETASGFSDSYTDFYNTSATAGFEDVGGANFLDITSATGVFEDFFSPFSNTLLSFG